MITSFQTPDTKYQTPNMAAAFGLLDTLLFENYLEFGIWSLKIETGGRP